MSLFSTLVRNWPHFLAFLFGAFYPLGLAPLEWWPALFLSVIGLVVLLIIAANRSPFWLCYWYGLGLFAVGASWVHVSIHTFGNAPLPLSLFFTAIFVAFLALFKAAIGALLMPLKERFKLYGVLWAFPILWVLSDYLQGTFLTGFPWLYGGYGLTSSPFNGLLAWVGVFGASYWLVISSTVVASLLVWLASQIGTIRTFLRTKLPTSSRILSNRVNQTGLTLTGFSIILGLSAIFISNYSLTTENQEIKSVGLVQPNIPQAEKWQRDKLDGYLSLYRTMSEPLWGADIVVWPEAAIPQLKHRVEGYLSTISKRAEDSNSLWIFGIPRVDFERQQIMASVVARGRVDWQYDKQHLVPFGEFVPLEKYLRGLIEFFNLPMSQMAAGESSQLALTSPKLTVFPAICYEIAYQSVFTNFLEQSSISSLQTIVTVSNDAWFGRSWGPWQHFQIARARAIEFGIPVIRATNNGVSAVISANGKVLASIPQFSRDTLFWQGELYNLSTPFSDYGSIVLLIWIVTLQLFFSITLWLIKNSSK